MTEQIARLARTGPPSADDGWPLLQRIRWRFVLLNLVGASMTPFALPYLAAQPGAIVPLYVAAMAGFAAWNVVLYRTGGRSLAVRLLGPVLVGVVGTASGHYTWAFGAVFSAMFLHSLYGSRGRVVRHALAYAVAYQMAAWLTVGPAEVLGTQLASMTIALLVMALVMAEMGVSLRRSDEARRRESSLMAASRQLLRASSSTVIAEVAVEGVAELVTASGGHPVQVSNWRQDGGRLVLAANWGVASEASWVPLDVVPASLVTEYARSEPLRLSPAELEPLLRLFDLPVEAHHGLAIPLSNGAEAVGVMFVRSREPVGDDLVVALQRFAAEVSLADRAARRNHLLGAVLANSADGIVLVDDQLELVFVSPSVQELVGRTVATGRPLGTLLFAGTERRPVGTLQELTAAAGELVVVRDDGASVEVEVSSRTVDGEGTVLNVRDVSRQRRLQEEIRYRAFHDPVTGLANRARFLDRLEEALGEAKVTGGRLAVALLDLDDFKTINDARGHLSGDRVLRHVADRVAGRVRATDTFARLGGDEFALLVEGVDDEADLRVRLDDLRAAMHEALDLDGFAVAVTASCGVVVSGGQHSAEEVLGDADIAMYAAKDAGKNAVVFFDAALREYVEERRVLRDDLAVGIGRDELRLHYQPVLALDTQEPVGVEALVRWQHPSRGLLGPDRFIPIAEDSGLVKPLGSWVLLTALRDLADWISRGAVGPTFQTNVNLSAHQLAEPGLVGDVRAALQVFGVRPSQLVLEITETALTVNPELAERQLRQLRGLGIGIAIDDFGTGYASFTYLRRFPVGIVKIDRSFVTDVAGGPEEAALARAIVRLADSLGMTTVAEGIEDEAARSLLDGWGCHHGQGWLWAPALPAPELLAWLVERRPAEMVPAT